MLLSANVYYSKKHCVCPLCETTIKPGEIYIRLCGWAEYGDPFQTLKMHIQCITPIYQNNENKKLIDAVTNDIRLKCFWIGNPPIYIDRIVLNRGPNTE